MNKKLILILACAGAQLHAMDGPLNDQLVNAAEKGNLEKVKQVLADGANVNALHKRFRVTALSQAVMNNRIEIASLLLKEGADASLIGRQGTAFNSAVFQGNREIVDLMLTTISEENAKQMRDYFITASLSMQHAPGPRMAKDVRKQLIEKELIDDLIQQRIQHVEKMLLQQNPNDCRGQTARDVALNHHPELAEMLDLNNPETRERIRKQARNGVMRVLFGEPNS